MSGAVNPIAGTGFARGAGVYATSRPGYPAEVTDWLRDRLGVHGGNMVTEVVAQVRALIARTPELADQDDIVFPYVTMAYDCRRLD